MKRRKHRTKLVERQVQPLEEFLVDTGEENGWQVVTPMGEVDISTAPLVRQSLMSVLEAGAHRAILDLSHCVYLDSAGLGMIIAIYMRLRDIEGEFRLVIPFPQPQRVLEITGADYYLKVFPSLDMAAVA